MSAQEKWKSTLPDGERQQFVLDSALVIGLGVVLLLALIWLLAVTGAF